MPDPVSELAECGRALSPRDLARLIELFLDTLERSSIAAIDEEWEAETARRLDQYDRGDVQAIDADEVFAKARSIARPR